MNDTTHHHLSTPAQLWALPRLMATAVGHLWSSDVNAAAIDLLDPRPGEQILDLGSGFGPATAELARRVGPTGRVTAVDPSRIMRLILNTRLAANRGPRPPVTIRAGTGEALPLGPQTIDAAISLNVMHHLDDVDQTVIELARILRPGGRLLLLDEDFADPDHSFHQAGGDHGPEFVDTERLAERLTTAGFTVTANDHRLVGGEPAFLITASR